MASSTVIERASDLLVVGGGAGGLAAARAAARGGAHVLLVQRGPLGGDCTFTGCVPSKALIEAAHRGEDFTGAIGAARRAVDTSAAAETGDVLRREGVEVLHGGRRSTRQASSTSTAPRSEHHG